jgi:hypothetical protein
MEDDGVMRSSVAYQLHPVDFNDGDAERFWSLVDVTDDAEDCWLWKGGLTKEGYGYFNMHLRQASAHRVAYVLTTGEGLTSVDMVCHVLHCAYRRCVNPAHLYRGDASTNMQDRWAIGSEVSAVRARINVREAAAIRKERKIKRAQEQLHRKHVVLSLKREAKERVLQKREAKERVRQEKVEADERARQQRIEAAKRKRAELQAIYAEVAARRQTLTTDSKDKTQ